MAVQILGLYGLYANLCCAKFCARFRVFPLNSWVPKPYLQPNTTTMLHIISLLLSVLLIRIVWFGLCLYLPLVCKMILVVSIPLKNDGVKVSWDDAIPNIWETKIHVPYGSKHCLRRYLSLQTTVNYTPNTS